MCLESYKILAKRGTTAINIRTITYAFPAEISGHVGSCQQIPGLLTVPYTLPVCERIQYIQEGVYTQYSALCSPILTLYK